MRTAEHINMVDCNKRNIRTVEQIRAKLLHLSSKNPKVKISDKIRAVTKSFILHGFD